MSAKYHWDLCKTEFDRSGTKIGAHILDHPPAAAVVASCYQKHIGPTLYVGPHNIHVDNKMLNFCVQDTAYYN